MIIEKPTVTTGVVRRDVEKLFNTFIESTFREKPEVKNFLHKHERKQIVIDNTCEQIRQAELKFATKMDSKRVTSIVNECAKMFCKAALAHIEEKQISEIKRKQMEQEAHKKQEIERIYTEEVEEHTVVNTLD